MLHLFTCHGRIIPRLAELLLLLKCFIEIPVFNANSVDPNQKPHSAAGASDLDFRCLHRSFL